LPQDWISVSPSGKASDWTFHTLNFQGKENAPRRAVSLNFAIVAEQSAFLTADQAEMREKRLTDCLDQTIR
jgi:hypothetical protein